MTTRQRVPYDDLRGYLKLLEENGLLKRITAEVDLEGELGAIAYRSLVREGPGLLFENIKDYPGMPLVANIMYTEPQLALALNGDPDWAALRDIIHEGMQDRTATRTVSTGPVKDVKIMGEDVDLDMLPTPRWHEEDGGRYIGTTAGFVTRDPQNGNLNMGQYRSMIIDKNTTTVEIMGEWPVGAKPPGGSNYGGAGDRNGATHVLENEANGLPTPCAIVLGMDPLLTLSCGTAVPHDENGHGEYEAAGSWAGRPVDLVQCETSDLMVPANAEIVLEGEVVPYERVNDGPHGESTGFYNQYTSTFMVRIKAITHRKDPISFGLICGRVEDYPRPLMRSNTLLDVLVAKSGLTNIKEVFFPDAGRSGFLIIRAQITSPEQPKQIIDAAYEHMRYRWVIVVDEDCNVRDWNDVLWRIVSSVVPDRDMYRGREYVFRAPGPGAVEFIPPSYGMAFDATYPFKEYEHPRPGVAQPSMKMMEHVAGRWKELGLS
ncbi:MAG: UbiD family decarboxylase [Chloroflexota bacterium]|nr:UbiD family decarboxylase [Chloroflexota bacterium]MDE2886461.1 UbiD family decarboxylase [Chloroflexota bacterium]